MSKTKNNTLLTPQHPKWDVFCTLLEGPEGCDFKEKIPGNPNSLTWKCKSNGNFDLTKAILAKHFPKIDVKKTIAFFKDHGGGCDCEILFNVDK